MCVLDVCKCERMASHHKPPWGLPVGTSSTVANDCSSGSECNGIALKRTWSSLKVCFGTLQFEFYFQFGAINKCRSFFEV